MLGIALLVVVVLLAGLWLFGERGHLLLPSTRKSLQRPQHSRRHDTALALHSTPLNHQRRRSRAVKLFDALHAYIYSRWTNQYIYVLLNVLMPRLSPAGQKWWRDHYHGKVLTHEHAINLVSSHANIPLTDLEQIVPYPTARNLVLHGPPEIAVYECACRHARKNGCQPSQVCMVVGESFVEFILEHNPYSSRRITTDEALELLRAEHERGHIHTAWFKDVLQNRFYAICNCCKCCCGGIEAMIKYGSPVLTSSGFVSQIDTAMCSSCGLCQTACPFEAITLEETAVVNWEKCMGCGVCQTECPDQAIALVRDEGKGIPLDVRLLEKQAII